jgi:WXG100 family type VII secretion target
MAVSQTSTELMETTARKFEDVNASLDGMLRRLLNELEGLRTQWTGAGGNSFTNVKQAWAAEQKNLNQALAETATAIRTAGKQYATTDSAAAGRFPTPHVNLPL